MKKQKLNFKKLSLQKRTIASMESVKGGAPRSLGCGSGTSAILNCTTAQDDPPIITMDPKNEICKTIFNSCKSYCPFC